MTSTTDGDDRQGSPALTVVAVVLFVVGVVLVGAGVVGHAGPPQPAAVASSGSPTGGASPVPPLLPAPSSSPTPTPTTTRPSRSSTSPTTTPSTTPATPHRTASASVAPPARELTSLFLGASRPVSLDVSGSDIHSTSFVPLSLAKDGTITVPGTADEVGLYTGGPTPGQFGPAVLAAHVDSTSGPGVFYRLGGTTVGDTITVGRADGKKAVFTVDRVSVFDKDHFPTALVYQDFSAASIRLVTCGGTFDKVKHYLSNVVVFGHLTSVR